MSTYKRLFAMALLIMAGVAFSGLVNADEVTFSVNWHAPTTRTDSTPLHVSDILEYRFYYAVNADVVIGDTYIAVTDAQTQTPFALNLTPEPTPYVINYAVTAVTKKRDVNGNYVFDDLLRHVPGQESALSNVGTKSFFVYSDATPEVPTQLDMTVTSCDGCIVVEQ